MNADLTLEGEDILCFANDWRTDPTSKHHLMRHLSAKNKVLWVESAGMRTPNFGSTSDWTRIVRKVKMFTRPARQELPNLAAYSPPTIPLPTFGIAQAANRLLYQTFIPRELARAGMSDSPIIWSYTPHITPMIRSMKRRLMVYHCVDRWSAFAEYDTELMERLEQEMCEMSDVVIASAEDLAERCRRFSSNVHYVPHGVDYAHFRKALEPGAKPSDLKELPRPRVGFFGLIHEWVDLGLLEQLARALPYEFVLIGASNQDMSALTSLENVTYLGRKPFAELPDYSRAFDVAVVPFRISELTMSVNPIKLREYAAAGLPVVSSPLPEVLRLGDLVRTATTTEEWITELRAAIAQSSSREWRLRQSDRVKCDDWSSICARIAAHVATVLPSRVNHV